MFWFKRKASGPFKEWRETWHKYVRKLKLVDKGWREIIEDCFSHIDSMSDEELQELESRVNDVGKYCEEKLPKVYEAVIFAEALRMSLIMACYKEE